MKPCYTITVSLLHEQNPRDSAQNDGAAGPKPASEAGEGCARTGTGRCDAGRDSAQQRAAGYGYNRAANVASADDRLAHKGCVSKGLDGQVSGEISLFPQI